MVIDGKMICEGTGPENMMIKTRKKDKKKQEKNKERRQEDSRSEFSELFFTLTWIHSVVHIFMLERICAYTWIPWNGTRMTEYMYVRRRGM